MHTLEVDSERRAEPKRFRTLSARERFISSVDPQMGVQVVLTTKALVTLRTSMRLVCRVRFLVTDKVAQISKRLPAHLNCVNKEISKIKVKEKEVTVYFACKRSFIGVCPEVLL